WQQTQKLERARTQTAQDQIGRSIARGADDRGLRTFDAQAFDVAEHAFGVRIGQRDDGCIGAQARDLRVELFGIIAACQEACALVGGECVAQLAKAVESGAKNNEGECLSHVMFLFGLNKLACKLRATAALSPRSRRSEWFDNSASAHARRARAR